MKVEILYFESCPSYKATIVNLEKVLKDLKILAEIELVEIESIDSALKHNFQGSPSIRIDGVDLENKNELPILGCRIYNNNGFLVGTPSMDLIRKALNAKID